MLYINNVKCVDDQNRIYPERDILIVCEARQTSNLTKLYNLVQIPSQILIIVVPVAAALLKSQQVSQSCGIGLDTEAPRLPLSVRNP